MIKYWTPPCAADYEHLNPPASPLPPVDCPLIVLCEGRLVRAERTGFIEGKEQNMEYQLESGLLVTGRFKWSYP